MKTKKETRETKENRTNRDIKMLKDFLRGLNIEALAVKYKLHASRIYKISSRDQWTKHKRILSDKPLAEARREVELELENQKVFEQRMANYEYCPTREMYFTALTIKTPPGVMYLSAMPDPPNCDLTRSDDGSVWTHRRWFTPAEYDELKKNSG